MASIRKLEFTVHESFLKIIFPFIYENTYLVYLSEHLMSNEWETLQSYVTRKKRLPENDAIQIANKILELLTYYSTKKIFHLKLHPKFIFVNKTNEKFSIKVNKLLFINLKR